jgi:hypothetical protein
MLPRVKAVRKEINQPEKALVEVCGVEVWVDCGLLATLQDRALLTGWGLG